MDEIRGLGGHPLKVLVLGGDGMLGHQLLKQLGPQHDLHVTVRNSLKSYASYGLFHAHNTFDDVDVRNQDRLLETMADFKPDAVINAVGIVKQRAEAKESIPSLELNSLLPHRLALLCQAIGARLVHVSTDCVFSGRRGVYREDDPSDAEDLYGKSKLLGEVHGHHCITLRTSIIGPELSRKSGLLEWFLAQQGTVYGYQNAIFSGLTTQELSRVINWLLTDFPEASGLYHVSSEPISKFALLDLVRERLGLQTEVVPQGEFRCDRSLDSTLFKTRFGYSPPSWADMIDEMAMNLGERRR